MTKTSYIGVRLTPDERRKVEELAGQAGTTSAEIVRALVRAAVAVRPVEATIQQAGQVGANHAATAQG